MRNGCPLMIFAAGFGTRMGALVADRPKPMLQIAGRRMIDRAIDLGEAAGCAPIVANTHYLAEVIEPVLAERGVGISREATEILDTGGGLRRALPLLGGETVATLNPDTAWIGPNPITSLLSSEIPDTAGALLLLAPVGRTHARAAPGDFALHSDGRLSRQGDHVYTGAQLIRSDTLAAVPAEVFSLNAVWDILAAEGRLFGLVYDGEVCDVGHPEGLALAGRLLGERP